MIISKAFTRLLNSRFLLCWAHMSFSPNPQAHPTHHSPTQPTLFIGRAEWSLDCPAKLAILSATFFPNTWASTVFFFLIKHPRTTWSMWQLYIHIRVRKLFVAIINNYVANITQIGMIDHQISCPTSPPPCFNEVLYTPVTSFSPNILFH